MNCPNCDQEMKVAALERPLFFADAYIAPARAYVTCLDCKVYKIVEVQELKEK